MVCARGFFQCPARRDGQTNRWTFFVLGEEGDYLVWICGRRLPSGLLCYALLCLVMPTGRANEGMHTDGSIHPAADVPLGPEIDVYMLSLDWMVVVAILLYCIVCRASVPADMGGTT